LEPDQQIIGEAIANLKLKVHLKDEYQNYVDVFSIFAEQRQKQHDVFCSLEKDGSFKEMFFVYARHGSFRNAPLQLKPNYPFFTLNYEIPTHEASSASFTLAVKSGTSTKSIQSLLLVLYYRLSTSLA